MWVLNRTFSDRHEERIPDVLSKDERLFSQLISNTFKILRANFRAKGVLDEQTKLSEIFYNEIYDSPRIKRGGPNGHPVSIGDFLSEAVTYSGEKDRTRYVFITGNYGIGKTTFVNWLITNKFREFVNDHRIWFVRLDLEDSRDANLYYPDSIFHQLMQKPIYIHDENGDCFKPGAFNERVAEELNTMVPSLPPEDRHYMAFRKLVRQIADFGQRLVIIIDNIDYYCHAQDRNVFLDAAKSSDFVLVGKLIEMIKRFYKAHYFKHAGANIIFVMRYDTYKMLNSVHALSSNSTPIQESLTYFLEPPGFRKSVENKCELVRTYVEKYVIEEGRRERYQRVLKRIKEDLDEAGKEGQSEQDTSVFRSIFSIIDELSNSGLRQFMEFFGQYGWIGSDRKYTAIPRFVHSVPVGVITFLLNGRRRYSQRYSQFPNLFLVSSLSELQEAKVARVTKYPMSYWLKYFILRFIRHREMTRLPEILEIFREEYGEPLVRKTLGDLYDLNLGFCVSGQREWNSEKEILQISNILPTKRGKVLADDRFVFSFVYTQLVVEDPELIVPEFWREWFDFRTMDKANIDYGYVTELEGAKYFQMANKMILFKSKLVYLFLMLLEKSLEKEQSIHRGAFDELERYGVRVPDFTAIERSILSEYKTLNRLLRHKIQIDSLRGLREKFTNDLKSWVDDIYQRY